MGAAISESELEQALADLLEESAIATFVARCATDKTQAENHPVELLFSRFREDAPDIESLAEYLSHQIVNYVVPLRKRRQIVKDATSAKGGADFSAMERLSQEAKRKFIEFDESNPGRASEIGELLAYLVAIEWLGAFQVASKMALKTSFNMPVHGIDGIHARFSDGVMTLFFVESKLSDSANAGISDFCTSAKSFSSRRKQYLLEYSIIADLGNLDALSPEHRELALTYLDVYGQNKGKRIERSVGIVCYSEKLFEEKLKKSSEMTPEKHEKHFAENYIKERAKFNKAFDKYLQENALDAADHYVWLVAVPDKNILRELFSKKVKT